MADKDKNRDFISSEDITADVVAWQLPTLGGRAKTPKEPEVKPPTAQELEAIRQAAHNEGLQQGKQQGIQQGIQQGKQEGYEEGKKLGFAEGFEQGRQQGLNAGETEIKQASVRLHNIMASIMEPLQDQQDELEQSLLNLTQSLAQSVIQQELRIGLDTVSKLVKEAVSSLPVGKKQIRIYLNPEDVELIREKVETLGEDWLILGDADMSLGGCLVKTEHSLVDFTLENRFQQLVNQMLENYLAQASVHQEEGINPEDFSNTELTLTPKEPEAAIEPEPEPEPESESESEPEPENNAEDVKANVDSELKTQTNLVDTSAESDSDSNEPDLHEIQSSEDPDVLDSHDYVPTSAQVPNQEEPESSDHATASTMQESVEPDVDPLVSPDQERGDDENPIG